MHLISDDEEVTPSMKPSPARAKRAPRAASQADTLTRFEGLQVMYPPGGGRHAVAVAAKDLAHLDPEHFLNDTLIDFYMRCVCMPLSVVVYALTNMMTVNAMVVHLMTVNAGIYGTTLTLLPSSAVIFLGYSCTRCSLPA